MEVDSVTILLCILKGTAAGWVSGLIYRALTKCEKTKLGVVLSAVACPIVNTGIFAHIDIMRIEYMRIIC